MADLTTRTPGERGLSRRDPYASSALDPFGLMRQMQQEMDRVFESFGFGRGPTGMAGLGGLERAEFAPQIEVRQRGDDLVVSADLPGIKKEDIKVDLEDDVLVISGERRDERREERGGAYTTERTYGSFRRAIPLPEGVDADSARAEYRDGVLEITLHAPQAKRRSRSIAIGGEAGAAKGAEKGGTAAASAAHKSGKGSAGG